LEGLRPRLPTIEQWQKGEASTPIKPTPMNISIPQVQPQDEDESFVIDSSTDELLGL